jgi:ATP-dependent Lhr-like helicase
LWRISNPQVAQQYRLNIGTIIEAPMLTCAHASRKNGRCGAGPPLGKIEEYFLETLAPGDTFLFSGKVLRLRRHPRERLPGLQGLRPQDPKVPAYAGGKFPLSTYLADRCAR